MDNQDLAKALLAWYQNNHRDLPWRHTQDPYIIWISEIMLQQTQVQTVIPYFDCFIQTLPTISALAKVEEATLLNLWAGLGYYSRARHLKRAAQQIVTDYQGQFPKTAAELENIIGIGPYTAGAIASIAFGEPVPAVDGNAYRVFSRIFADNSDISKSTARKHFQALLQPLMPSKRPGDFNQAVMDLGSDICSKAEPACLLCPLNSFCQAYRTGTQLQYPVKTKKIKKKQVQLAALVIQNEAGAYLFQTRAKNGLLGGLLTFPLVDQASLDLKAQTLPQALMDYFQVNYNLVLLQVSPLKIKPVKHVFTHLVWTITLVSAKLVKSPINLDYFPGQFIAKKEFAKTPMPTLQKKLYNALVQSQK